MELMFRSLIYAFLFGCALLVHLVDSQGDQSGFISLDCGLPTNSSYSEPTTTINYISDAPFIDTGVSKTIGAQYKAKHQQQMAHVRSFPQGIRNCYTVNITSGTKYLIRASFLYGNYDGLNKLPRFDLHMGPNFWESITISSVSLSFIEELIHIPSLSYIQICLVNTGSGTPFISSLELRPLSNITYASKGSLVLSYRLDVASKGNQAYRYNSDAFNRIWMPYNDDAWTQLSTMLTVQTVNYYDIPTQVMDTASTPINANASMDFFWEPPNKGTQYYVYAHFAELQQLKSDQYRAFNITMNGQHLFGPLVPRYLSTDTIYSPSAFLLAPNYTFSLHKIENSTLPPIISAIEIYTLKDFSKLETNQDDIVAITNIKSTYGLEKNWEGDPCAPEDYIWEGITCSSPGSDPPRLISLNLSSSGLTGEITGYISNLVTLQYLDLSNNNLSGSVPAFLSGLANLKILNLEKNKLTGTVPAELVERSRSGSLMLSVAENDNLCPAISCATKKKKNVLIPVIASIGGAFGLLIIAVVIFMCVKRGRKPHVVAADPASNNQNDSFESKRRQFTYAEVLRITNDFETILGKGGFGTVYHGYVDDTQVAVKMLSPSSAQGYKEFHTEVKLLMRVHHRNLTSLVGYCNEGVNMALIYEYMANGNLEYHLLGNDSNVNVLSWEGRLQIAVDASQGLEYLHSGCRPPIVHRDVKTTNILLAENFQAKLADFGLSRAFPNDEGTHMSTAIVGTLGYLDPEYHTTGRLNEKSDVYSFGVALLQIITSRPVISRAAHQQNTHVSEWVSSMLGMGDIKSIVDLRLRGDFEVNSAWKTVELAMECMSETSTRRPNMSEVVTRLKECLAAELDRKRDIYVTRSTSTISYTMNVTTELNPSAR